MSAAVLLMDLQRDFIAPKGARLPADPAAVPRIVDTANIVLGTTASSGVVPIVILNQFLPGDHLANFFRHGAAIAGSWGGELDDRISIGPRTQIFTKTQGDAFSNPQLLEFLSARQIKEITIIGVFAEGCVLATVMRALRLGFEVKVVADAIASDSKAKTARALAKMERAGATVMLTLMQDKTGQA
jgi:nicotinamidase-related amidase